MIEAGYHDVPPGHIAAVVTYLEMRHPPSLHAPCPKGITVRKLAQPSVGEYRTVFRAVGEPWLWFSRMIIPEPQLTSIIHHAEVDVFFLEYDRQPQGLLEMDRRHLPDIELTFFGLAPAMIGKGAGRFLIEYAIQHAFSFAPARFWLHTCTLDSPQALGFYRKVGFTPYKRAVEVAPDPRLTGKVPRTAAPQIPIIEGCPPRS